MGKNAARISALGAGLAVSAAVVAPGVANAAPSPALAGDCAATLQHGHGGPGLLLDAGAALNSPGRLTVGLDSSALNANGSAPLLTLPLGDTLKALGVGDLPVVGPLTANGVCPVAQGAVNAVADTTQSLLGGVGVPQPPVPPPPGPEEPPAPEPPAPPVPPAPPGPVPPVPVPPGSPGNSTGPIVTGPGSAAPPGDAISGIVTNAALLPGTLVRVPVVSQVIPGQALPGQQVPPVDAQDSGTAEALPDVTPPAKLPMLLAVLALALVAAALVRTWIRRRPA